MAKNATQSAAIRERLGRRYLEVKRAMRPLEAELDTLRTALLRKRDQMGVGYKVFIPLLGEVRVTGKQPQKETIETALNEEVFFSLPLKDQMKLRQRNVVTNVKVLSKANNGRIYYELWKGKKYDLASQPSNTAKPMGENERGRKKELEAQAR